MTAHRESSVGAGGPRPSSRSVRAASVLVLAFAAGCLEAACSTTYQPRHTGRVSLAIRYASAIYVKDGREVAVGPFSGELEALVAETPAAAAHARKAHLQLMIGIPAYLTGAAGIIIGVAALSGPVGWIVIGAGASSVGTGLGLMGAGFTHILDAVHLHNDEVPQKAQSQVQSQVQSQLRDQVQGQVKLR